MDRLQYFNDRLNEFSQRHNLDKEKLLEILEEKNNSYYNIMTEEQKAGWIHIVVAYRMHKRALAGE